MGSNVIESLGVASFANEELADQRCINNAQSNAVREFRLCDLYVCLLNYMCMYNNNYYLC